MNVKKKLVEILNRFVYDDWYGNGDIAEKLISNGVTIERHGQWIASHDEFCACSICKYPVYVGWNQTNYCPNCGAKMDLDI